MWRRPWGKGEKGEGEGEGKAGEGGWANKWKGKGWLIKKETGFSKNKSNNLNKFERVWIMFPFGNQTQTGFGSSSYQSKRA